MRNFHRPETLSRFSASTAIEDLERKVRVCEGPRAKKEEELEAPLWLLVDIVFDDDDPPTLPRRRPHVPEHRDKVIHEFQRSHADFLRHASFISPGASPRHSPSAGPGYLSGRFGEARATMGERLSAPPTSFGHALWITMLPPAIACGSAVSRLSGPAGAEILLSKTTLPPFVFVILIRNLSVPPPPVMSPS